MGRREYDWQDDPERDLDGAFLAERWSSPPVEIALLDEVFPLSEQDDEMDAILAAWDAPEDDPA